MRRQCAVCGCDYPFEQLFACAVCACYVCANCLHHFERVPVRVFGYQLHVGVLFCRACLAGAERWEKEGSV